MMRARFALALSLASALSVRAHVAAFGPGMYCQNVSWTIAVLCWHRVDCGAAAILVKTDILILQGLSTEFVNSTDVIIEPLYGMKKEEWWMHGDCKYFQPPEGEFLEL